MKTPREILLSQHQAARPKLDAIRDGVIERIASRAATETFSWREFLWPSPRAWAALAAGWVVILGMNLAAGNYPHRPAVAALAGSRPEPRELRQQQQMLTRLIAPEETAEAVKPSSVTAPRGELHKAVIAI